MSNNKIPYNLSGLEFSDLSENRLHGSISSCLNSSSLRFLFLQKNSLSGAIPHEHLRSPNLLNLSPNHLTVSIPVSFSNLKNLESLDLCNNNLSGEILGELARFTQTFLETFTVSYNNLSGRVPDTSQFGTFDENNYRGNPGLCGKLIHKSCKSDEAPQTPPSADVEEEDEGGIEMVWFYWSFSGAYVTILLVLAAILRINRPWRIFFILNKLEYLDLSWNLLDKQVLKVLGTFSALKSLDLRSNLMAGQLSEPGTFKFEVETEYSNWVPSFKLKVLLLPRCNLNKLSNTIPTFLFYQHELKFLHLSHNNLTGRLDRLLENKSRLELLPLRNNSFVSKHRADASFAIYLNLSKNSFEGSIPSSIRDSVYLQQLDMSFNNFSGEKPKELVANSVNLQTLKLSSNYRFHGQIISARFNLTFLEFLQLENNQFTGSLSKVILRSSELVLFDISNNISKCLIMNSLIKRIMNKLEHLDLSWNLFITLTRFRKPFLQLFDKIKIYLPGITKYMGLYQNLYSTLTTLDIRDNNLSNKIISSLAESKSFGWCYSNSAMSTCRII
uniref:Leucine-rich repeat-containing N-terminal plant-type domain-containing protein n=1 Tax=Manihot esculenta TaxID=3983 RepID=A0A199UB07_MANES